MKTLFLALVVAGLLFGYYYFFVDTLTLSEIADSSENSAASLVAGLVNFDTGLTRFDIHRLSGKAETWSDRWRETESIPDPAERRVERDRLLAEMMDDPAFRKISDRVGNFGERSAQSLLDLVSNY